MRDRFLLLCAVVLLNSCKAPRAGPKLIEADGVVYTACQGAIWIPKEKGTPGDNEPVNYEVRFRDAQGVDHELTHVRTLRITDLPADTPTCQASK